MSKFLPFIVDLFRMHKAKMILALISALIFAVTLFPYDDLSEVVSTFIAEKTNNQVFLQFDKLGFQLFPYPALAVENVVVESSFMPNLAAQKISLAPSIAGLLSFRPGFTAGIRRVWNGDADLTLKSGKKTEQGAVLQNVNLDLDQIDLAKANEVLDFPLKLQGALSGRLQAQVDPGFSQQPDGEAQLFLKDLRFPAGTIPTQLGPMSLPGMSWSSIQFKGRFSNGKFQIDPSEFGSAADQLHGSIRGEVEARLDSPMGGQAQLIWGAYKLTVDLNISNRLTEGRKDLDSFLSLFQQMLKPGSCSKSVSGLNCKFAVSAPRFGVNPEFSLAR